MAKRTRGPKRTGLLPAVRPTRGIASAAPASRKDAAGRRTAPISACAGEPETDDGLHAPSSLPDSARVGISRATMNAKASSASRAAVKIAVRSPRSNCSQASM